MKSLQLNGPWAALERKNLDSLHRISQLEAEVRLWKGQAESAQQELSTSMAEAASQVASMQDLQAENSRAKTLINALHDEVQLATADGSEQLAALSAQVSSLAGDLSKLSADNAVLKAELAKSAHVKADTHHKLENVRAKLGLTESEAKVFVQELDDLRASSKAQRAELCTLSSDKAALQSQVEARSQHCMTLIAENKRLLDQVAELRQQVASLQQGQWGLKKDLEAAQAAAKQRKPLVQKEKPSWQAAVPLANSSKQADLQNRPPWHAQNKAAGSTSKTANISAAALEEGSAAPHQVAALRQALALRSERLAASGSGGQGASRRMTLS